MTAATVIGVDETTINVNGTKQRLHVARTELLTAYHLHFRRGRVAVDDFAILPTFTGTVMRDALAVYDSYPATHALCGAHLLRELTAISETDPTLLWPTQARDALLALNAACQTTRDQGLTELPDELAAEHLNLFRHAVSSDSPPTPAPTGASSPRPGTCSNACATANPRSSGSPPT